MEIKVNNDICWMCGSDKNLTYHHVIPQTFKPVNNVCIPLCRDCHDRLHEFDGTLTMRHLNKTLRGIDDVKKSLGLIKKNLDVQTIGTIVLNKQKKK